MTEQQLNATVHRLTRDHRSTHTDTDTGKTSYPTEMALFTQLRQEITSSSRPSTGASSGPRIPVALAAVVLWDEIRETLSTMYIAITGKDEPTKSPEDKLQKWAAWTQGDVSGNETQKCLHKATAWAAAIDQLISRIKPAD